MDEAPIDSVISLLEIQLYCHETGFNFSNFEAMKKFMDDYLVFYNPSARDERRLARQDELMEDGTNLCNQEFGNDLIYYVAQTYWLKVID